MADVHIQECWCKLCLSQYLECFDQFNCNQLINLLTTISPRSTSEAFNEAFDKTVRTVVAGKACGIAAERKSCYKQLKRHFQWLGYVVEDAKRMSNKLNNASWRRYAITWRAAPMLTFDVWHWSSYTWRKTNHGVFFTKKIREKELESQMILSTMIKILWNWYD